MPLSHLPPGTYTRHDIARALEWAWTLRRLGHPLTVPAAIAVGWPYQLLQDHPRELAACEDRAHAVLSGLSVSEWLKEMGRKQSTHARNWKNATQRIADALNVEASSVAILTRKAG